MAYNLLTILCRTADDAAFAAAKLGSSPEVDRLFVLLQSEASPESMAWMRPQDRTFTLERAIEHPDAEGIGVRAAVLYSGSHYWTLLFCWAHDCPEDHEIPTAISALNRDLPLQGKLWGNLRENIVFDGFEAVSRPEADSLQTAKQSPAENVISEELELSFGMRGLPVSRKTLIHVIAESAPLRGVGIHHSVQKNNPFWNDIQSLIEVSASVVQDHPSTFILGHCESAILTLKHMSELPKHSTAIIFATKASGENLVSQSPVQPYRVVYGKEDIMALLFKIA